MADQTAKASEVLGAYGPGDPFADMGVVIQDNPEPPPVQQAQPQQSDETQIISSENLTDYLTTGNTKQAEDTPVALQQQEGAEEPISAIELTPDTMVIDYRDGKTKPFKEIEGSTVLKEKYDKDQYQLQRERAELDKAAQYVQNNLPYLEAIEKSNFASVLATALVKNIPEDQAIASAMASIGRQVSAQADPDPRPVRPDPEQYDRDSKEYLDYFLEDTQWQSRQEARKATAEAQAPLLKKLQEYEQKEAQQAQAEQQAQTEAQKRIAYNQQMMSNLYDKLPFKVDSLTPEQQKDFNARIDRAAVDLQISGSDYLRMSDVVAIASMAFGNTNPYAAAKTQAQTLATAPDKPQVPNKKTPLQPGINGMGSAVHFSPDHNWGSPNAEVLNVLESMAGRPGG